MVAGEDNAVAVGPLGPPLLVSREMSLETQQEAGREWLVVVQQPVAVMSVQQLVSALVMVPVLIVVCTLDLTSHSILAGHAETCAAVQVPPALAQLVAR